MIKHTKTLYKGPLLFIFALALAGNSGNTIQKKYALGFSTLDKEVTCKNLSIEGVLPTWLSGTLFRNGPAKFEVGKKKLQHWFDGYAMLHSFSFHEGKVSYANKFLESTAYKTVKEKGQMEHSLFATDPCRSIFRSSQQTFVKDHIGNANVNISKIAHKFVALTENTLPVLFVPNDLKTIGVINYQDSLEGNRATAHPHYDPESKEIINYFISYGARSSYNIYRIIDGSKTREVISTIPVQEPAYMHSFAITKNYVILAAYPFVVNPSNLLQREKPFIENFKWKAEQGTCFYLLNRKTKELRQYKTEAFFSFHHINAFEKEGKAIIDILAYPDAAIIQHLYLDVLRGDAANNYSPTAEVRRYEINFADSTINYERLTDQRMELPRINEVFNTKNYRFFYAAGSRQAHPGNFMDRLVKFDNQNRTTKIWEETTCYPGEPVFISSPHGQTEDDGLILSLVLHAKKGKSFLLILDAASFKEQARVWVPHHIPFGFHGQFYKN